MIGNKIEGLDNRGQKCSGVVMDKVLVVQTLEIPGAPGDLRKQAVPIALDAYLVFNEELKSLHLVSPVMISAIEVAENKDFKEKAKGIFGDLFPGMQSNF